LTDVVQAITYHVEYHNSRYFIVDYLQLVTVDKVREIHDRVEIVSHTLREVAMRARVYVNTGLPVSKHNLEIALNELEALDDPAR
jgi:hypothetical protein